MDERQTDQGALLYQSSLERHVSAEHKLRPSIGSSTLVICVLTWRRSKA